MAELLAVPLKKATDVDMVKPLRNLLAATYGGATPAPDHADALQELARLRSNALWKVYDKTCASLDDIYSYHDQLASLESKVPPQEVQIPFKWKDAFDRGSLFGGRMSLTISSLAYERVCVLFNMAAAQSSLAAQEPLDTEDSLKLAAKLLQQAAGVFSHLKTAALQAVHAEPTPDLRADTLQALAQLMLAQAQEVIAYKCMRDEMKDSTVAKVCAQCEELYTDALRALQKEQLKPLWEREWIATVTAKVAAFRGLAQYHQAAACRAAGAVGEEIARLQAAAEGLRAAERALQPAGGQRLRDAAARAQRRLADATRDNDFIYHERVPEAAQLEPVARAAVAQPLPPPARWASGRDLFADLVPLAVHAALQASAGRRAELVGAEIDRLRDATRLLNGALAALGLPASVEAAPAEGGALPASLVQAAAEVRAAGGLPALERQLRELPELLQRNRDILDEAERLLREEAQADEALRAQFGARWTRTASAQLTEAFRANAAKYAQIIDNAVRADAIVQQKLEQHREYMELLSRDEQEIAVAVPAAEGAAPEAGALGELRALLADVDALKAERDALEAELKDATVDLRDRFLEALAADGAIDEPALSAGALGAAMAPLQARVQESLRRQERLLGDVQRAHAALGLGGGGGRGRGEALGRLTAAADAHRDLSANLGEGTKFYNDLTQLLVAFQNKVSDYCFARKTEKDELLKDLTQEAARGGTRPAPPAPSAEPLAVKKEAPPRPPPPSASGAPLPYPAQPQGMPLPYAPQGAPYAYYAPPPMPAMYNPYATLPYPHHARMPPPQQYQPYRHPQQQGYQPPPPAGYNPYPQQ